jgi:hypothetical protein
MDAGMEIHKRLGDYVREMESPGLNSIQGSRFGLSIEGQYFFSLFLFSSREH